MASSVHSFNPPSSEGFGLVERKPLPQRADTSLRREILNWFQKNYPKIKQGTVNAHLILVSTNAPSRIHYNVKQNGVDDLLFQTDRSHFRLYEKDSDPLPIYKQASTGEPDDSEDENVEAHEFAYERDLRNFLSNNISINSSLRLTVYQDGDINGIEFPAGERYIDILAMENN